MSVPARRTHQAAAARAVCEAFDAAEDPASAAATVVMASGTGKTLLGVYVAQDLGASRLAVLVPSLALVAQVSEVLRAAWPDACLLQVCGSSGASAPASRDVAEIAAHLAAPGRRMVVATHRSAAQLAAASRLPGAALDLVVVDEAHHCVVPSAGPTTALLGAQLCATRRLFMTATPRTWRVNGAVEPVGMDEARFGPRVFELALADAVAAGLVCDYRVVLAVVERSAVSGLASRFGDDDARLVAGAVAVLRTMAELGLRRCVSFHSRVSRAATFARMIGEAAQVLSASQRPSGPGFSAHVSARTSPVRRAEVLRRLGTGDGWAVLSNARCLGEGVDVPEIDTVAIVDPKTSAVEVTQAVGRALRGAPGKVATVVLPVLSSGSQSLDTEVASSVLRALRAHDAELGARLDAGRRSYGAGVGRAFAAPELGHKVLVHVPAAMAGELAARIATTVRVKLVREAGSTWDEWYGALSAWVDEHGHAAVPQGACVAGPSGPLRLGQWCSTQRMCHRRGVLSVERVAALEALSGWSWEPTARRFAEHLGALERWAQANGSASPPQATLFEGLRLGQWVNVARTQYVAGALASEKVEALESVKGWTWDVRADAWERHFAVLEDFVARHGHARPSSGPERDLARWVSKQRVALRAGALGDARVSRLRALPGWVDHAIDAAWEDGFRALEAYAAAHGHVSPSQAESFAGVPVGRWVAKQRARAQRLSDVRRARLETLPGWRWVCRAPPRPDSDEP